jgi:hypothetical protein
MEKKHTNERGAWHDYNEFEPTPDQVVDVWADGRRYADYVFKKNYNDVEDNNFFDPYYMGKCCIRNATHWMLHRTPTDEQGDWK